MNHNRRDFLKNLGCLTLMFPLKGLSLSKEQNLPKVLILGDSISIGYTPYVIEQLKDVASVSRPAENCQGTTNAMDKINGWIGDTEWDVIHFNFGLHDMKHVDPSTGKNSTNPEDPQQADVKQYARNLTVLTKILKETGAKLVFATTTPFPASPDGPLRKVSDVAAYNRAALKIMKKYKVAVNDLHHFSLPRMAEMQIPNNVHFTKSGSAVLGEVVAAAIKKEISADKKRG